MSVTKSLFGFLPCGREVYCFKLTSQSGLEAEILDYGATLRTLKVPDKNKKLTDVVLGYDTIDEYVSNDGYFGATVGRFANRIKNGKFTLNGKEYSLATNDGKNHLHGGNTGFDKRVWSSKVLENGVEFSLTSPDGDEGYPGNLNVKVTVTLCDSELNISYFATTDADTILNLTNHSYFNLDGGKGTVFNHLLTINSDSFTVNDFYTLPTGEIESVKDTALDFRSKKRIGQDILSNDETVKFFGGYDTNFILNNPVAAVVQSENSGIVMTVITDQPGMQFYSGNKISFRAGKNRLHYDKHSAFCLETQHFPDSINHPEWPDCVLKKGEEFVSFTKFCFSLKK